MGQIVVETTNAIIMTEKNDVYASISCFLSSVWYDAEVCFFENTLPRRFSPSFDSGYLEMSNSEIGEYITKVTKIKGL